MVDADVLVVGSGAAGLVAALTASSRGAAVTVIESADVFGGTTATSGGALWLPGSRFDAGDSHAETRAYLDRCTMGLVPSSVLDAFVARSPEALEFIEDRTPIEFEGTDTPDYHADHPGARSGRSIAPCLYDTGRLGEWKVLLRPVHQGGTSPLLHSEHQRNGWGVSGVTDGVDLGALVATRRMQGITGRGNALAGALMEACIAQGVTLIPNIRATRLQLDDSGVSGLSVLREGVEERYRARRGVVLACGGFEWDALLVKSLIGLPLEAPLSPPYNRGDGLKMASRAGARLAQTRMAWWVPALTVPGETVDGTPSHRTFHGNKGLPGAICVNRYGRRFANEAMNYNDFGQAMATFDPHTYEFPNLPAWVILDDEHIQRYPLGVGIQLEAGGERVLYSAPTLRALAEEIGVDAGGLEDEVGRFNREAEHAKDPVFRRGETAWETYRADSRYRNPNLRPLGGGPYHAYQQRLGCFGTKGGPATDHEARVLDFDDRPIPRLFAAGNAAASIFGPAYPGAGATLGPAMTFGYIAGSSVTA